MNSFLSQIARHYYKDVLENKLCFIFPNRRSLVFFRKSLSDIMYEDFQNTASTAKATFVPDMYTINDFFYSLTDSIASDNLSLLLELYEVYKEKNIKAESLDLFLSWASMLISDFNEIDKYLVNAKHLFTNIYDYKEMVQDYDFLDEVQKEAIRRFIKNFDTMQRGDESKEGIKEGFINLWHILYDLYLSFKKRLRLKSMSYAGMVYRELAERFKSESAIDIVGDKFGTKHFVFIGFNALTTSEKVLMKSLYKAKLAEFCWDYSSELIKDVKNRSSFFMQENIAQLPQAFPIDSDEALPVPNIRVIESPSSIGQAKLLPLIFQEIADNYSDGDISKIANLELENLSTAIVLPDEKLLNPVINSIPEEIEEINITMGYDFFSSESYLLLISAINLQLNIRYKEDECYFYHRDFKSLLSNSLIKNYIGDEGLLKEILAINKYYISRKELADFSVLDKIFTPVITNKSLASESQIDDLQGYLQEILSLVSQSLSDSVQLKKELPFTVLAYSTLNKLRMKSLAILPVTYLSILRSALSTLSVHFRGEPLAGLQIMGPLEMRALDFNNLIILSCNENIFPRKNVANSFIPASLRKAFYMPTYEYQDAVWAYYFYRMIQRAKNVWLVYDSREIALQSGEESRYIKQLQYLYKLALDRRVLIAKPSLFENEDILVKPENYHKLLEDNRLSASAIQNYLTCSLKFYYANLLHLSGQDEVVESADASIIGSVYHNTMYSLYSSPDAMSMNYNIKNLAKDIKNARLEPLKYIERTYIKDLLSRELDIKKVIERELLSELKTLELEGRNLVIRDIVLEYVKQTLRSDDRSLEERKLDRFRIIGLEFSKEFNIDGLRFIGYIDRLDSFDETSIRILDYKTGKVQDEDINIDDDNAESIVEKIFSVNKMKSWPKIALQLYIYYKLISTIPEYKTKNIINAIYSLSRMYSPNMLLESRVSASFINLMDKRFTELLAEIKDLSIPFKKTSLLDSCAYCDFKKICGR